MSSDPHLILEAIPTGTGLALDLGGNNGLLRRPLKERGYHYINLDIRRVGNGEPSLIGDAHHLPFVDASLDLVVSKDTLEHFLEPWVVVREVHRVLKDKGRLIIWVPFMHPVHGKDFYRFTPLGLRHLLRDFELVALESPLWAFTVVGFAVIAVCKRMHLGFLERPIRRICMALDRLWTRRQQHPASFTPAYRVVACKWNSGAP
jgi:SAM-dependent methyltransferase